MSIQKNKLIKVEEVKQRIKETAKSYVSGFEPPSGHTAPYKWDGSVDTILSNIQNILDERLKKEKLIKIEDVYQAITKSMYETTRCCYQAWFYYTGAYLGTKSYHRPPYRTVMEKGIIKDCRPSSLTGYANQFCNVTGNCPSFAWAETEQPSTGGLRLVKAKPV